MTTNTWLILACTFGVVLALGLQSLNVNGGHHLMAAVTSFAIGTFNLALLKLVPQPTTVFDNAAYLLGGPIGILVAMKLHPYLVRLMLTNNSRRNEDKE
jgi:uncharacterized protein YebE (UPF0316 family)